jgi:hypothetical protein
MIEELLIEILLLFSVMAYQNMINKTQGKMFKSKRVEKHKNTNQTVELILSIASLFPFTEFDIKKKNSAKKIKVWELKEQKLA